MKVLIAVFFLTAWLVSGSAFAETDEPSEKVIKQFMQYDMDESGDVSREEYLAIIQQRAHERFDAMDRDRDEIVTPEEYDLFWRARKAQIYQSH